MYAESPETKAFVAVHLTGIAAEKHFALDDLGVEQGGGKHQQCQYNGNYSESLHVLSI